MAGERNTVEQSKCYECRLKKSQFKNHDFMFTTIKHFSRRKKNADAIVWVSSINGQHNPLTDYQLSVLSDWLYWSSEAIDRMHHNHFKSTSRFHEVFKLNVSCFLWTN